MSSHDLVKPLVYLCVDVISHNRKKFHSDDIYEAMRTIYSICPTSNKDIESNILSYFKGSETITFNGMRYLLSESGCQSLIKICGSTLRSLSMDGCHRLNLKGVKIILSNCNLLEELSLAYTKITDDVLQLIGQNSTIKKLSLSGCNKISDEGLSDMLLSDKLQLESLNVSWCKNDMFCVSNQTNLKYLNLIFTNMDSFSSNMSSSSFSAFRSLKQLEHVVLGNHKKFDQIQSFVKELSNLKKLEISTQYKAFTSPNSEWLNPISITLKHLRLYHTYINQETLETILTQNLKRLEVIELIDTSLGAKELYTVFKNLARSKTSLNLKKVVYSKNPEDTPTTTEKKTRLERLDYMKDLESLFAKNPYKQQQQDQDKSGIELIYYAYDYQQLQ
eukprot:TRINITY_DN1880_c0_g1_i1.p1 TRINITY_DN1880_c0_g1~~TRINITY_DN1880_c0_g1_i1.p1  ORF type:complete len:390 (-),score=65.78 TRINITY_DN1880_c0_g1_i1:182-1351(-)